MPTRAKSSLQNVALSPKTTNKYTLISEGIQRAIVKGWIGLRGTSVETRQSFLGRMEKGYAELVEGWRKEGGM